MHAHTTLIKQSVEQISSYQIYFPDLKTSTLFERTPPFIHQVNLLISRSIDRINSGNFQPPTVRSPLHRTDKCVGITLLHSTLRTRLLVFTLNSLSYSDFIRQIHSFINTYSEPYKRRRRKTICLSLTDILID